MFFSDVMGDGGQRRNPLSLGNAAPLSPQRQAERDKHEKMVLELGDIQKQREQGLLNQEKNIQTVLGLDLGQTHDPSSAVTIARDLNWERPSDEYIWKCLKEAYDFKMYQHQEHTKIGRGIEAQYWKNMSDLKVARLLARRDQRHLPLRDFPIAVKRVQEWPLGTDYFDVVEDVLVASPNLLVPDFCGVGRPVYNIIRRRAGELQFKGRIIPVQTVTSAMSRSRSKMERGVKGSRTLFHQVPKRELITSVVVLEESARLILLENDPMTEKMMNQLGTFKMTTSKGSRPTQQYAAAQGAADDLVVALALSLFAAMMFGRRKMAILTP